MKKLTVGILLAILTTICLFSYEPLTDQEVLTYWSSLTKEQRIEEIRKLDIIEHTTPEIVLTTPVAVVTGRDVTFYYLPGENAPEPLQINVGPYLSYGIELEPVTFEKLIPKQDNFKIIIYSALGGAGIVGVFWVLSLFL